jgi:nitroreductase
MNTLAATSPLMTDPLALLQQRRSVPSRQLGEPAPDEVTLQTLLEAAIRVPDHGKLVPFRLIRLQGEAKGRFGELLAARAIARDPTLSEALQEKERLRYSFAPLVIVVVACLQADSKVPEIERTLCAGNVAHNLLLGAHALGFGAQWLTGWAAYDQEVKTILHLGQQEHVVGFIHLGTPQIDVPDRDRPQLADLLSNWTP